MGKARTRGVRNAGNKSDALYKFYMKNLKPVKSLITEEETLGSYNIKKKEYRDILMDINNEVMDLIISEGFEFRLPYRLGTLRIRKKKIKYRFKEDGTLDTQNLKVDWKSTNDLWNKDEEAKKNKTVVFHTNAHTNKYLLGFFWSKRTSKSRNLSVISFHASRANKRRLAKVSKNPYKTVNYLE